MTTALRALALLGSTGALVLRPALTPTPLACNLRPRAISAMMDADSDAKARIAKLEETLRGLEADGYGDALEPLRTELAAVKKSLEAPAPAPPPPPPPPERPIQAWTPPEETTPEPAAPPPPIKAWTPEPEPPAPAPRPVEPPAPVPPAPPVTSRMNALRAKTEKGYVAPTSKPTTAGAQGVNFWDAINPFKAPESAETRAARIARNEEREAARRLLFRERPLVSVIAPGKNEGKHIPTLVDSLTRQTYRNMVLLVHCSIAS